LDGGPYRRENQYAKKSPKKNVRVLGIEGLKKRYGKENLTSITVPFW